MRNNQRLIQLTAAALAVVLVASSSLLLRPINQKREAMGLSATIKEVESMPPDIALSTIALGGFRGLAVDYFWIRAEMLKEQGRFYEANQLANWICKLQPRFAKVWAFQAWNLGWNISVATRTFEERWNWIYNGAVKLLRDEAIRYNPKALSLYRELAWIFFFKMGDYMDDFQWAYKRQWAWDMQRLLGEPPADIQAAAVKAGLEELLTQTGPQPRDRSQVPLADSAQPTSPRRESGGLPPHDPTVQRVIDWFTPIADAPATWDQFVAEPEMAAFVRRCEDAGIQVRVATGTTAVVEVVTGRRDVNLQFLDRYQRVLAPTFRQQFERQTGRSQLGPDEKALLDFLADPETKTLAERLIAFLRAQVLRHTYKMDPPWMLALMKRFGPIDWRLTDSHGIYWTSYGVKVMQDLSVENVGEYFGPNTPLNTDRLMLFALQRFTFVGRLFFEPDLQAIDRSYLDVLPDLRYVQATHDAYLNIANKYDPETGQIAGEDFRDGHQNYLRDVIRFYYLYGQRDLADHYYAYLRTQYRLRTGEVNPDYMVPMEEFVTSEEFRERLSDMRTAMAVITSYLEESLRRLAAGEGDKALAMTRYVKQDVYDWYMARLEETPVERMRLPGFQEIYNDVVSGWLAKPVAIEAKVRLWQALPVNVQVAIYDKAADTLRQQLVDQGYAADTMAKVFPEPPGLTEFRQQQAAATGAKGPEYREGVESAQQLRDQARQQGDKVTR